MFYTFHQNNSGGSFVINNNVAPYVIVEADSAVEANQIAEELEIYFNGCSDGIDCECCGDRWWPVDEDDGTVEPKVYDSDPDKVRRVCVPEGKVHARVFYKDGTRKEYA
jgi:hypothetical protein